MVDKIIPPAPRSLSDFPYRQLGGRALEFMTFKISIPNIGVKRKDTVVAKSTNSFMLPKWLNKSTIVPVRVVESQNIYQSFFENLCPKS